MNIKPLILSLLCMAVTLPAVAQMGEQRSNWAVGISGGTTFNNVNLLPKVKQNLLMGYTGGITARYISEKYFAMICGAQLELNFIQRGWDEQYETSLDRYNRTLNYLEIPFMAHLGFGKERGVQFFVNAGPQLSFIIGEKETFSNPWNPEEHLGKTEGKQYGMLTENNFDYGIVAGAGLEVRTGAGNFLIEGRYYLGLADIFNSTKKDYFEKSSNTTISAKITYLFDLTK